jgi:decaprenyl-phosphate phosphoribosyltransferase
VSAASKIAALVRAARPAHAVKNVPVLAPALFGRRLSDPDGRAAAAVAFGCFCLAAAAGYLWNDARDVAADRAHPRRRTRPIAAGTLSPRSATVAAAVLAATALSAAFALLPGAAAAVLAAYLATTATYTLAGRRVVALATAFVAAGFVLRVLGGALAVSVAPSPWLLILTAVLAVSLALAKREAEARRSAGESPAALRLAVDAGLAAAAVGYLAWTLWPSTVALHGTRALWVTALPVVAALLRFRARLRADRDGRSPADLVARDPLLLALGAAWAVSCALVLAVP